MVERGKWLLRGYPPFTDDVERQYCFRICLSGELPTMTWANDNLNGVWCYDHHTPPWYAPAGIQPDVAADFYFQDVDDAVRFLLRWA